MSIITTSFAVIEYKMLMRIKNDKLSAEKGLDKYPFPARRRSLKSPREVAGPVARKKPARRQEHLLGSGGTHPITLDSLFNLIHTDIQQLNQ